MGWSWGRIRKQLEEELLCKKLHGRVQYFFTIYHHAPDQYGRFAIRVDGAEIYQASPYHERYYYKNEYEIKSAQQIPTRQWDGKKFLFEEENQAAENEAAQRAIEAGRADSYDVLRAIKEYLSQPAEKSLWSDNLLLRMFAVLDRRIGKRTLEKLADICEWLPGWLQPFYGLRLAVEEIPVKNKSELLLSAAQGPIYLYRVDDEVIDNLEGLLHTCPPCDGMDEQDFVAHIKKKKGEDAICLMKEVSYAMVKAAYRDVKWMNL